MNPFKLFEEVVNSTQIQTWVQANSGTRRPNPGFDYARDTL